MGYARSARARTAAGEPGLADYVLEIQDCIDARAVAAATAKEKAEEDKTSLAAEEQLKADRERARVSGDFVAPDPEPEDLFAAMVHQV